MTRKTAPGGRNDTSHEPRFPSLWLSLLSLAAVLVEGYHFGVDDGAIYIPAVERAADPRLFPFGAEFFLSHARLSVFGSTVGGTARLGHLPVEATVLLWHVACTFALLGAGWLIACALFRTSAGRWGAVALLAGTLPVPVAGTALSLGDNYLSARSFSTPCGLLAVGLFLHGRRRWAAAALGLTALFHPQMAAYCAALLLVLRVFERTGGTRFAGERRFVLMDVVSATASLAANAIVPHTIAGLSFAPATGMYREVLYSRTYFFARMWEPYEWIGVLGPLAILAFLASSRRAGSAALSRMCQTQVLLGLLATAAFLLVSTNSRLDMFTRLQPMRMFHLIYLLFFLVLGGLMGERVLRNKPLRWALLFVPLAAGMFALDRSMYGYSPHLEMPGRPTSNAWLEAFRWTRENTPRDAVFALDPAYTEIRGEDTHGFRAVAERSVLADAIKDSGAVTMFPRLLGDWEAQQEVQRGWRAFGPTQFTQLSRATPATWVVVQAPQDRGLDCPYVRAEIAVCRIGESH